MGRAARLVRVGDAEARGLLRGRGGEDLVHVGELGDDAGEDLGGEGTAVHEHVPVQRVVAADDELAVAVLALALEMKHDVLDGALDGLTGSTALADAVAELVEAALEERDRLEDLVARLALLIDLGPLVDHRLVVAAPERGLDVHHALLAVRAGVVRGEDALAAVGAGPLPRLVELHEGVEVALPQLEDPVGAEAVLDIRAAAPLAVADGGAQARLPVDDLLVGALLALDLAGLEVADGRLVVRPQVGDVHGPVERGAAFALLLGEVAAHTGLRVVLVGARRAVRLVALPLTVEVVHLEDVRRASGDVGEERGVLGGDDDHRLSHRPCGALRLDRRPPQDADVLVVPTAAALLRVRCLVAFSYGTEAHDVYASA